MVTDASPFLMIFTRQYPSGTTDGFWTSIFVLEEHDVRNITIVTNTARRDALMFLFVIVRREVAVLNGANLRWIWAGARRRRGYIGTSFGFPAIHVKRIVSKNHPGNAFFLCVLGGLCTIISVDPHGADPISSCSNTFLLPSGEPSGALRTTLGFRIRCGTGGTFREPLI